MNVLKNISSALRRMKWLVLLALLVLGVLFYFFNPFASKDVQSKTGRSTQSPAVAFVAAVRSDVPVEAGALGTVSAFQTVNVLSKIEGDLTSVNFHEGQIVKKGQVLFKINVSAAKAALAQAQGNLLSNQATLNNAIQDLKRYQILNKQDSIAKQKVDTQQALVKQLVGTVEANKGALSAAALQVSYGDILAPIDGRVGLKTVDVGSHVLANSTTALTSITQTSHMLVEFSLPDQYLAKMVEARAEGTSLTVQAWDKGNQKMLSEGTLVAFDNQIDPTTNTFKLKADFKGDSSAQLFPSQFVNVKVKLQTLSGVLALPQSAVQTGPKGKYVWVIDAQNKVHNRPVKVGQQDRENMVIDEGVNEGEHVVTDGLDRLMEGLEVRPMAKNGEVTNPNTAAAPAVAAPSDAASPANTPPAAADEQKKNRHHQSTEQTSPAPASP